MDDDAVMAEVRRAEGDLYRAQVARDREALRGLLAPDLVYVHSTAVAESREQYLDGVAQGLYEYESIDSREVRVRVHGDVALVDGICDMRVGAKGGPAALLHLKFVLVFVRKDGKWLLMHRHGVRMPERA